MRSDWYYARIERALERNHVARRCATRGCGRRTENGRRVCTRCLDEADYRAKLAQQRALRLVS